MPEPRRAPRPGLDVERPEPIGGTLSTPVRRRLPAAIVPLALLVACSTPSEVTAPPPSPTRSAAPSSSASVDAATGQAFTWLEERFDARLGVYAVDTTSGRSVTHRADERFAYASTVKVLAAAVVPDRTTPAELAQVVPYDADDLVAYSPVTEERLGTGMTLGEVAEAAVRRSDNTAANLLLERIGGPPALDAALAEEDRAQLVEWMSGNTTGDALVRAGVPAGWDVADKSGAAAYGTRNDIAVVYPPDGEPIVVAIMSDRGGPDDRYDDALVAEAARVVVEALR